MLVMSLVISMISIGRGRQVLVGQLPPLKFLTSSHWFTYLYYFCNFTPLHSKTSPPAKTYKLLLIHRRSIFHVRMPLKMYFMRKYCTMHTKFKSVDGIQTPEWVTKFKFE